MTDIRKIKKEELEDYLKSNIFKHSDIVPISTLRAISQARNPYAVNGDVLLYVIEDSVQVKAYLGALPAVVNINNQKYRCAWLTCLWVDTSERGKGIATKLIKTASSDWEQKVFITEYIIETQKLYEKTGEFQFFQAQEGLRYYNRFQLQSILPPKFPFFEKRRGVLKFFDAIGNGIFDLRFLMKTNHLKGVTIERVKLIDQELAAFIHANSKGLLFPKDASYYQWFLDHPWVITSSLKTRESERYHFTSIAAYFELEAYKIYNQEGELEAFLIFSNRDGFLKLPFAVYTNEVIVAKLVARMLNRKVHTFTLFDEKIIAQLMGHSALFAKKFKKNFLSSLGDREISTAKQLKLQDGEGDSSFT